jgi:hypothetical protein
MILDANVIKGFFLEDVLGLDSQLTANATPLIQSIENENKVYVDVNGIIESEWRNVVDPEWFDIWYSEMIYTNKIIPIRASNNVGLRRELSSLGFPNSRDIWYVRVAEKVADMNDSCNLFTEDIHFYDPRKGHVKGKARIRIMCSNNAAVKKLLRKRISTYVMPVISFIEN